MVGMLDMNLMADNAQTLSLFNWTPIEFKESVLDAAAAVQDITR
jgi:dihydroflavonol-4-reductase